MFSYFHKIYVHLYNIHSSCCDTKSEKNLRMNRSVNFFHMSTSFGCSYKNLHLKTAIIPKHPKHLLI